MMRVMTDTSWWWRARRSASSIVLRRYWSKASSSRWLTSGEKLSTRHTFNSAVSENECSVSATSFCPPTSFPRLISSTTLVYVIAARLTKRKATEIFHIADVGGKSTSWIDDIDWCVMWKQTVEHTTRLIDVLFHFRCFLLTILR